jgi:hypothetical protein
MWTQVFLVSESTAGLLFSFGIFLFLPPSPSIDYPTGQFFTVGYQGI